MWQDHPWLGVGAGQYLELLGLSKYNPGFKPGIALMTHNTYLQALTENGIVGFLIVLLMLLSVLGRQIGTWNHAREAGEQELQLMAAVLLSMTVALLTAGVTADFLYSKNIHLLFALTYCLGALPGARWGPPREAAGL
jgi:O-antigen ligase